MEEKQIKKENYTVQVGYSDEAKEKKLLKFVPKDGEFEVTAEELASMIKGGVNDETLEAAFVETEKIHVVEIKRQLVATLDEDKKKGDEIRLEYTHPYPLEFALIEQLYNIAKIEDGTKMITLTEDVINEVKDKLGPEHEKFIKTFYKSFENVDLDKK